SRTGERTMSASLSSESRSGDGAVSRLLPFQLGRRSATVFHYERSHLHSPSDDDKILLVNDALESLAMEDPLQARVVELRFFAGLSNAEASRAPGVSALHFGKPTRRHGA